jgi:hypothetical protein
VLSGIALIVAIVMVAGFVAYIGDRVGHQVGRRRLTLFGLRPKYTSTIVAVATGMVIALAVTLIALVVSNEVRTAFFRLDKLNGQISALQAQAQAQREELDQTRYAGLSLPRGYMIANIAFTLHLDAPEGDELQQLGLFFDQVVASANQQFTKAPFKLRPYPKHALDPEVQVGLSKELEAIRSSALDKSGKLRSNLILVLPVAATNLFPGDEITFNLAHYLDIRLARAGEALASQTAEGGSPLNLQPLIASATIELAKRGMPRPFLLNPSVNAPQVQSLISELSRLRGKYRITAKSSFDLYPHSGTAVYDFTLAPGP